MTSEIPLTLTAAAQEKVRGALAGVDPPRRHLRIRAADHLGPAPGYQLKALADDELQPEDSVLEFDGFVVVLDPDSLQALRGTIVDYRTSLLESGFTFANPDAPRSPVLPTGARPDLAGSLPDRVRMLLETEINPAIAAHGGRVSLVDVRERRVYLAFGGGCHGCSLVDVTLKQGIRGSHS